MNRVSDNGDERARALDWRDLQVYAVEAPADDAGLRTPIVRHEPTGEAFALVQFRTSTPNLEAPISEADLAGRVQEKTVLLTPPWQARSAHTLIVLSTNAHQRFSEAEREHARNRVSRGQWPGLETSVGLLTGFKVSPSGYWMSYLDDPLVGAWVGQMTCTVSDLAAAQLSSDLRIRRVVSPRPRLEQLLWLGLSACFLSKQHEQLIANLLGLYFIETDRKRFEALSRGLYNHDEPGTFVERVKQQRAQLLSRRVASGFPTGSATDTRTAFRKGSTTDTQALDIRFVSPSR